MLKLIRGTTILALLAVSQGAGAITLQFDYSLDGGFFTNNPDREASLQAAGHFFEGRLTDSLSAISSSGGNQFSIDFTDPATGNPKTIDNYSVAADTLVVFVGARALSGGVVGVGEYGGWHGYGSSEFLDQAGSRGQGVTGGPAASDFGPWGGSLSFSSTATWHFDSDPSTLENFDGTVDFYSVALHELGHLFGFGTSDSWSNKVINGEIFTGPNAEAAYGGNAVPLNDPGHWQEGLHSTYAGTPQEVAMDPSILVGTRKHFTELDLAALRDVGWQVTPTAVVPLPPAAFLFLGGMLGLLRLVRRRS